MFVLSGCPRAEIEIASVRNFLTRVKLFHDFRRDKLDCQLSKIRSDLLPSESLQIFVEIDIRFEHGQIPGFYESHGGGPLVSDHVTLDPGDVSRSYVWTFESLCADLDPLGLENGFIVEDNVDLLFNWKSWQKKMAKPPTVVWKIVAMNEVTKFV